MIALDKPYLPLSGINSIVVSPDGRHVYAGGYYSRLIVAFDRSLSTGLLKFRPDLGSPSSYTIEDFVHDRALPLAGLAGCLEKECNKLGYGRPFQGLSQMTLSSDGQFLYSTSFLGNSVTVMRRKTTGALTLVQTIKNRHILGTRMVDGLAGASSLFLSYDDRSVYVTGYTDQSLVLFRRDKGTGVLEYVDRIKNGERRFEDFKVSIDNLQTPGDVSRSDLTYPTQLNPEASKAAKYFNVDGKQYLAIVVDLSLTLRKPDPADVSYIDVFVWNHSGQSFKHLHRKTIDHAAIDIESIYVNDDEGQASHYLVVSFFENEDSVMWYASEKRTAGVNVYRWSNAKEELVFHHQVPQRHPDGELMFNTVLVPSGMHAFSIGDQIFLAVAYHRSSTIRGKSGRVEPTYEVPSYVYMWNSDGQRMMEDGTLVSGFGFEAFHRITSVGATDFAHFSKPCTNTDLIVSGSPCVGGAVHFLAMSSFGKESNLTTSSAVWRFQPKARNVDPDNDGLWNNLESLGYFEKILDIASIGATAVVAFKIPDFGYFLGWAQRQTVFDATDASRPDSFAGRVEIWRLDELRSTVCTLAAGDCFALHQVIDGVSAESDESSAVPGKTVLDVYDAVDRFSLASVTCSGGCMCEPSTQASGHGTLSDGPSDYKNNARCKWLIESTALISLVIDQYHTELNYDYITINRCMSPLCETVEQVARLSGTYASKSGPYTSSTGYLQVVFTSDRYKTSQGFKASWSITRGLPSFDLVDEDGSGCVSLEELTNLERGMEEERERERMQRNGLFPEELSLSSPGFTNISKFCDQHGCGDAVFSSVRSESGECQAEISPQDYLVWSTRYWSDVTGNANFEPPAPWQLKTPQGMLGATGLSFFEAHGERYLGIAQSMCPVYAGAKNCELLSVIPRQLGMTESKKILVQPKSCVLQWNRALQRFTELLSITDSENIFLRGDMISDWELKRHAEFHSFAFRLPLGIAMGWESFEVKSLTSTTNISLLVISSMSKGTILYNWDFQVLMGLRGATSVASITPMLNFTTDLAGNPIYPKVSNRTGSDGRFVEGLHIDALYSVPFPVFPKGNRSVSVNCARASSNCTLNVDTVYTYAELDRSVVKSRCIKRADHVGDFFSDITFEQRWATVSDRERTRHDEKTHAIPGLSGPAYIRVFNLPIIYNDSDPELQKKFRLGNQSDGVLLYDQRLGVVSQALQTEKMCGFLSNGPCQSVSIRVTQVDGRSSLFARAPELNPDGRLKFTPMDQQVGSAKFRVEVIDSGFPSPLSETRVSAPQFFFVEVVPVNTQPNFDPVNVATGMTLPNDEDFTQLIFAVNVTPGGTLRKSELEGLLEVDFLKFNFNYTTNPKQPTGVIFIHGPELNVSVIDDKMVGTVTFKTRPWWYGTIHFYVKLDGGGEDDSDSSVKIGSLRFSETKQFNLTIAYRNTAPGVVFKKYGEVFALMGRTSNHPDYPKASTGTVLPDGKIMHMVFPFKPNVRVCSVLPCCPYNFPMCISDGQESTGDQNYKIFSINEQSKLPICGLSAVQTANAPYYYYTKNIMELDSGDLTCGRDPQAMGKQPEDNLGNQQQSSCVEFVQSSVNFRCGDLNNNIIPNCAAIATCPKEEMHQSLRFDVVKAKKLSGNFKGTDADILSNGGGIFMPPKFTASCEVESILEAKEHYLNVWDISEYAQRRTHLERLILKGFTDVITSYMPNLVVHNEVTIEDNEKQLTDAFCGTCIRNYTRCFGICLNGNCHKGCNDDLQNGGNCDGVCVKPNCTGKLDVFSPHFPRFNFSTPCMGSSWSFGGGPVQGFPQEIAGSTCGAVGYDYPEQAVNFGMVFVPLPETYGEIELTVVVKDDGGKKFRGEDSFTGTFVLQLIQVNEGPKFVAHKLRLLESSTPFVHKFAGMITATNLFQVDQNVSFVMQSVSDLSSLFQSPPFLGPHGTLEFSLRPFSTGYAQITFMAFDDGGTTFFGKDKTICHVDVNVLPFNLKPRFDMPKTIIVVEDSPINMPWFIRNMSKGSTSEYWQTLAFSVLPAKDIPPHDSFRIFDSRVCSMASQCKEERCVGKYWMKEDFEMVTPTEVEVHFSGFEVESCNGTYPYISHDGMLIMRPARDQHGVAVYDVVVQDDGGTAYGGQDTNSSPLIIKVLPQPRVWGVSPRMGPASGNNLVTIFGQYFGSFYSRGYVSEEYKFSSVSIGGVECLDHKYLSDSEVLCRPAPGIGSGCIFIEIDDSGQKEGLVLGTSKRTGALEARVGYRQAIFAVGGSQRARDPTDIAHGLLGLGPSVHQVGSTILPASSMDPIDLVLSSAITAIAVDRGHLYAGGGFATVTVPDSEKLEGHTVIANRIFQYNGNDIMPLGAGANGEINVILPFRGMLAMGGAFTEVYPHRGAAISSGGLALWDPLESRWSKVAGLPTDTFPGVVMALAAKGDFLIVGGKFDRFSPSTKDLHGIGMYHAPSELWFSMGSGVSGGHIQALLLHCLNAHDTLPRFANCTNGSSSSDSGVCNVTGDAGPCNAHESLQLYAGGTFNKAGQNEAKGIAMWDGSQWKSFGNLDGSVHALAYLSGWVYVGGSFTQIQYGVGVGKSLGVDNIARHQNGVWERVGTGVGGPVYALQSIRECIYIGGFFDRVCDSETFAGTRANRCAQETDTENFQKANSLARMCYGEVDDYQALGPKWEPVTTHKQHELKDLATVRALASFDSAEFIPGLGQNAGN